MLLNKYWFLKCKFFKKMWFILLFMICVIEEEIYMVNYGCIFDDRVFLLFVLYMKLYDVGVFD